MCETCGCNLTSGNMHIAQQPRSDGVTAVNVLKNLMSENDTQAAHNREHLERHNVFAVNLMSSPGAGKTALLEASIERLGRELRIGVIEGDLETENDAARIRRHGIPAVQITTGSACHLDAHLIHKALHALDLDAIDLLFIENVGNLVCPAGFDLGQHRNVVLLSVTEGDDKPAKYPVMFRAADLVLLSKCDLLGAMEDFDHTAAEAAVRALGREVPVIHTSARRELQLDGWLSWLREACAAQRESLRHYRPVTDGPALMFPQL
ncbi:MAG: hydrogenase nickel incorporation protein HypB [Gammaproteobacteria bacterium]|nr:hydrogenase nickel incorporation protein HypB [Gammaproteobacteria bacterium]MDE2345089.1 hydrogenase nickel incorporation protein HypB [Gammaproteobacteria bacterium]